jgi:hypothetical protein
MNWHPPSLDVHHANQHPHVPFIPTWVILEWMMPGCTAGTVSCG